MTKIYTDEHGRKYTETGRHTSSLFGDGHTVVGDPGDGSAWLCKKTITIGTDTFPYPVPDGLPILKPL